jgi:hypothetical protein
MKREEVIPLTKCVNTRDMWSMILSTYEQDPTAMVGKPNDETAVFYLHSDDLRYWAAKFNEAADVLDAPGYMRSSHDTTI